MSDIVSWFTGDDKDDDSDGDDDMPDGDLDNPDAGIPDPDQPMPVDEFMKLREALIDELNMPTGDHSGDDVDYGEGETSGAVPANGAVTSEIESKEFLIGNPGTEPVSEGGGGINTDPQAGTEIDWGRMPPVRRPAGRIQIITNPVRSKQSINCCKLPTKIPMPLPSLTWRGDGWQPRRDRPLRP